MPLVDSREELTDAQNFLGVNGNIRSLSGRAPGWFCDDDGTNNVRLWTERR